MGAAASVRAVYADALSWFRQYFDEESYVTDFYSIDKDHDGGIRYAEFVDWLKRRADSEGGPWRFFVSHPEIVATAHIQASQRLMVNDRTDSLERIVDIADFRALLIQLFAVSVIWTHFKKADDWQSASRQDSYDGRLGVEECILGVRTFCASYGQEVLSDEQIRKDFSLLDSDGSGQLSLLEVCNLCNKLLDPSHAERMLMMDELVDPSSRAADLEEKETAESMTNAETSAETNADTAAAQVENPQALRQEYKEEELQDAELEKAVAASSAKGSNNSAEAMASILHEVDKNSNIAEFVELKFSTQRDILCALGDPNALPE